MKKENRFVQKISQDTYHVKRYLVSCENEIQLENVRVFCENMMQRWQFDYDKLSNKQRKEADPLVDYIISDIKNTYMMCANDMNEYRAEQKKEAEKRVVVRGYC